MMAAKSMEKSKSPGPQVSDSIAHIWDSTKKPPPTYIIEEGELVTINRNECQTSKNAVEKLNQQVARNIQILKDNGIEVKEVYIGKTFVLKEGSDIKNAGDPTKWDKSGLSSRWSTSHSKPARNEMGGKRNMIVLTTAITERDIPDDIKNKYKTDPKKSDICAAEYYTLELERELIKELNTKQSEKGGKVGKNLGYALYMRITHRKKLDAAAQQVRSI